MSDTTFDELPYIKNGETITIKFNGHVPNSVTLTEYILNKNGERKYTSDGMVYDINFGIFNHAANFTIKKNYATALSSSTLDYMRGNTIKGYKLVCAWGNNECEYSFIIRGDAAITFGDFPTLDF